MSMPSLDLPPKDLWYEIQVVSRLTLGEPDDDPAVPEDFYSDQLNELLEDEVTHYNHTIEQRAEFADSTDDALFEAPAYLLDKLTTLSDRIRNLEWVRDRLIAFARSYAIDPESMRVLANATGLSHTTIMRIADDAAIRAVAAPAREVAEMMLGSLNPRDNPDLYARLSKIVADTRQVTEP